MVIGRSSRCDLAVSDRWLSRQHLRVYRSEDDWMVEDMGSRNGTRVNGMLISGPTAIKPGDIIATSMSIITFGGPPKVPEQPSEDSKARRSYVRPPRSSPSPSGISPVLPNGLSRAAPGSRPTQGAQRRPPCPRRVDDPRGALDHVLERVFVHLRTAARRDLPSDNGELTRASTRSQTRHTEEFPESTSLASEVIGKGLAAVVLRYRPPTPGSPASESLLDAGVTDSDRRAAAHSRRCDRDDRPQLRPGQTQVRRTRHGAAGRGGRGDRAAKCAISPSPRRPPNGDDSSRRWRLLAASRWRCCRAEMPQVAGVEIHGGNTPSRGVSGDYYQIVDRPEPNEIAVIIADVSGKGIGASLLTGYVDALVNAYLGEKMEPAEIFNRVSPQMNAKTPVESFATAFLGIYSVETGAAALRQRRPRPRHARATATTSNS